MHYIFAFCLPGTFFIVFLSLPPHLHYTIRTAHNIPSQPHLSKCASSDYVVQPIIFKAVFLSLQSFIYSLLGLNIFGNLF